MTTLTQRAPLPIEHTSFVDRRSEVASARDALGATRLLTVLGPGGVGKSRFVLRLADNVRKRYADNVWYVDLSSVSLGGSVADHVATRLGLQSASRDQAADLARYFGGHRGLLVLDSCEHVVEGAAGLARWILESCPGISIIATSQAILSLTVETVFPLSPLALPGGSVPRESSSVQLFLDRARSASIEPAADELDDVAEICRKLDGIPLAIELAATRSRVLSPRQILARLDAPLTFLTTGDRDLPPRQRTLKATIAWSYGLCTEDERELWRLMSVFAGSWDLESAERMMQEQPGSNRALDTVASLLDKSIIQRRGSGTHALYAMLDTVRAFGLEMSDPREQRQAGSRHRDWCLERLSVIEERWAGPDQAELLKQARHDLPDLRAAVEFAIAGQDGGSAAALLVTAWRAVWQANGRFDELRRWGLRVLALDSEETTESCQLRAVMATVEVAQGQREECLRHLDDAQVVADRLSDPLAEAMVAAARAYVDPDPQAKVLWFTRSLEVQGGSNILIARADVEERLANAYDQLGETETATAMRSSLVERAMRSGERYDTANMLMNAGINAIGRGEPENATALLRRSLSLKQGLGSLAYTAITEEALAVAASLGRDFERVAIVLGSARSLWEAVGAGGDFSPLAGASAGAEAAARAALGSSAFDAAFRRGRELSLDAGAGYALGEPLVPGPSIAVTSLSGGLTARELQVAALVGEGLSDREIAERLVISQRTAEGHVSRSLMKLGFSSRSQLAVWAARRSGD